LKPTFRKRKEQCRKKAGKKKKDKKKANKWGKAELEGIITIKEKEIIWLYGNVLRWCKFGPMST
jgi:hypothetical protein